MGTIVDAMEVHNKLCDQWRIPMPGPYIKTGVPVGRLPAERQSLPLASDLTNHSDPVRSQTTLEPMTRERQVTSYAPPARAVADWKRNNEPRSRSQSKRAPSERVRAQAALADKIAFGLEQKRLDTAQLRGTLSALSAPRAARPHKNDESTTRVWGQLSVQPNAFASVVAGRRSGASLVPTVHDALDDDEKEAHETMHRRMLMRAATTAYLPAGKPIHKSIPYSYSSSGAVSWGRPSHSHNSGRPDPTTTHVLGLWSGARVI